MIRTTPKKHQVEGARFLVRKKYGILAFKTGKGKTLTSLACIHQHVYNKNTYAIVIAPVKAYEKVWPQEIRKHSNMKHIDLARVYSLWQSKKSFDFLFEYDIVLVKYSEILKYSSEDFVFMQKLFDNRIVTLDEAHKIKNPAAKMVRVLTFLSKNAKAKWGLTATAIGNSVMDLWGLMQYFEPRLFGTELDFKRRYCVLEDRIIGRHTKGYLKGQVKKVKEVVDFKNLDELNAIKDKFMMVVDSDIDVTFHEIKYNITEAEEKTYLKAAKGILERDYDNRKGFAQRIPDLQRVVDGSRNLDGQLQVDFRSSKYVAFRDKIKELLGRNESVILFAEFNDTLVMLVELIREDFRGVPVYEISGRKIEDPHKFPCIVLITAGGSESLNLKFANHVLFFSVPFTVRYVIQCTGRITRMDSDFLKDLNVYLPVCEINIDYYKYKYLKINSEIISKVLGRESNLPPKAKDDERKSMLGALRKDLLYRTGYRLQKKK